MKPILTGFFDTHHTFTFNELIEFTDKYQLDQLCLRVYHKKPLIEVNESDIKEILQALKAKKNKIAIIDSNITPFNIHNQSQFDRAFDEFKFMVKLAEKLKVNYIIMKPPIFTDVIQEFEQIQKLFGSFVDYAMRSNKKIILELSQNYKANTYAYMFKKIKSNHLGILFDPVYFMMNNESTTTAYRLLKGYIFAFAAHDANHQGEPELIGYGKTDAVAICKKLIRDRYDGFILMDNSFHPETFDLTEVKKGFFSKLFSNEKKKKEKIISTLSKKIFPNEETKNVTYDDILENQIKLIKTIFK